jgi:hypothetical protein
MNPFLGYQPAWAGTASEKTSTPSGHLLYARVANAVEGTQKAELQLYFFHTKRWQ